MGNFIVAIRNIIEHTSQTLSDQTNIHNRANALGDGLEKYIQNMFASAANLDNNNRLIALNRTFSYLGNNSNPPDAILKNGDAIEVKKVESFDKELQLNSSYPKNKLHSSNPLINAEARSCEDWSIKDMLYCIGSIQSNNLRRLWMVYGDCFCADSSIYTSIREKIENGINNIEGISFSPTKELGRINNIDPLSHTHLRIRGMWLLKNPNKIFQDRVNYDNNAVFELFALITRVKFESFSQEDQNSLNQYLEMGLSITDIMIQNPNNPALLIECKLLTYKRI